ncbi:hypothetical protein [Umezawaea beigongshangensis]|uniref:hypothetical protein n=1 Tax=Umezawaea beigongshangensis TaxID=2780383 RepID=UPI0018F1C835|nr:hypothetical protein [Umezawaea beigongshangensis]
MPDNSSTSSAGAPPGTAVPADPAFSASAGTELVATAQAVQAVDADVRDGTVQLDEGSAEALIRSIADAQALVWEMHDQVAPQLETELKLGDNWVARSISRRLREVGVGDDGSAVHVIREFLHVLKDVEDVVRQAAEQIRDTDQNSAASISAAGRGH